MFQGRFGAKRVTTDGQLLMTVAHIARNPVEAGLCAEVHGWRWSSHAAIGAGGAPAWLAVERLRTYRAAAGADRSETSVFTPPNALPATVP